jgi:hypothetical protein
VVAKLAFTPTNEDWLFLRILRHRDISSLFAFLLLLLLLLEDLAIIKIYRMKIYCKNNQ